jgi:thiol:disulfide interchange protein DsbD
MNLSGNPLDFVTAFLGGILVSFSPCVYPLMPVTLSFIGIDGGQRKISGFILSLVYVSGIALVYALLGLLAALSGSIFGMISVHPATRVAVGIVFIFFGLSLWDVLPFRTVAINLKFLKNKSGRWKVFLLGLSSGLVISPCVSPVLGSILLLASAKKNLLYAAGLLLSFAYGMGLVLILCGTFSNVLANLPHAGDWMNKIKKLGGLILMGAGVYFIFLGITGG